MRGRRLGSLASGLKFSNSLTSSKLFGRSLSCSVHPRSEHIVKPKVTTNGWKRSRSFVDRLTAAGTIARREQFSNLRAQTREAFELEPSNREQDTAEPGDSFPKDMRRRSEGNASLFFHWIPPKARRGSCGLNHFVSVWNANTALKARFVECCNLPTVHNKATLTFSEREEEEAKNAHGNARKCLMKSPSSAQSFVKRSLEDSSRDVYGAPNFEDENYAVERKPDSSHFGICEESSQQASIIPSKSDDFKVDSGFWARRNCSTQALVQFGVPLTNEKPDLDHFPALGQQRGRLPSIPQTLGSKKTACMPHEKAVSKTSANSSEAIGRNRAKISKSGKSAAPVVRYLASIRNTAFTAYPGRHYATTRQKRSSARRKRLSDSIGYRSCFTFPWKIPRMMRLNDKPKNYHDDEGNENKKERQPLPLHQVIHNFTIDWWSYPFFEVKSFFEESLTAFDFQATCGLQYPERLGAFFTAAAESYSSANPFHNFYHAIQVYHVVWLLLSRCQLSQYLLDIEILGTLLGSFCHDIDHPGVNNDFFISTEHPTALVYNDVSVLENHHCAFSFKLLSSRPELDFREGMSGAHKKMFRRTFIKGVLATDMQLHSEKLSALSEKAERHNLGIELLSPDRSEDRTCIIEMSMHAADVSNPLTSPPCVMKWASLIIEEFNFQCDREERLGLERTVFMDCRTEKSRVECQIGFLELIALPMWRTMWLLLPELKPIIQQGERNSQYWHEKNALLSKYPVEQLPTSGQFTFKLKQFQERHP